MSEPDFSKLSPAMKCMVEITSRWDEAVDKGILICNAANRYYDPVIKALEAENQQLRQFLYGK